MASLPVADPIRSRCLVIGSGIAGLQFALLAAARGTVRIVTKKESSESNTNYAQGGIAAAVSPLDDFDLHVRDTLDAGDGLCDEAVVRRMVEQGPALIERLLGYGVDFSREDDGDGSGFALGREGGHSRRRVLHCRDLTGREIESRLLDACLAHPAVTIEEDHMGLDLLRGADVGLGGDAAARVVGAVVLDRHTSVRRVYLADAVVLATGGCGKVYRYTSNPDIATGDGLAMAFRAGAELRNLEFVQFHPTCLYHPEAKSFLISEAVRGEGAVLINRRGERFMARYHPLADLAPRDVVARSIDHELKTSGDPCAFLDLRHLDRARVQERFPNLVRTCAGFGIDMAGEPVPVVPAAHYMCGGVATDLNGKT
ncbi:MAG: L-aspartate oxidase, partial [Candidatus Krumholzibacteriia bacterium]